MKNTLLFILVLFSAQLSTYGQSGRTYKSTIVFSSDVLTSVMVNDPIDNAYNLDYTTNTYKLTPRQPITHIVKINGFSTIKVEYSNGLKAYLLVLENEHIEVCIANNKIIIKGDWTCKLLLDKKLSYIHNCFFTPIILIPELNNG